MDGCYYCKEFNPIWDELCEKIKHIIPTVKYNANEMEKDTPKKIIAEYGEQINGFPTILIKINNTYHNYNGNRKVKSIVDFILGKIDKNDKIYKSLQQDNSQPSNTELTYFYMDGCYYCNQFNPIWNELCNKLDNNLVINKYERAELNDRKTPKRIVTEYGKDITSFPTLLLKVNDKYYKYEKERTTDSLIKFIASKLDEHDKLYKFLLSKYAEIITKKDNDCMEGGFKKNNINNVNYRNKYKKYKQMYADLAIKYNELKLKLN